MYFPDFFWSGNSYQRYIIILHKTGILAIRDKPGTPSGRAWLWTVTTCFLSPCLGTLYKLRGKKKNRHTTKNTPPHKLAGLPSHRKWGTSAEVLYIPLVTFSSQSSISVQHPSEQGKEIHLSPKLILNFSWVAHIPSSCRIFQCCLRNTVTRKPTYLHSTPAAAFGRHHAPLRPPCSAHSELKEGSHPLSCLNVRFC